jgi:hypothetical protein
MAVQNRWLHAALRVLAVLAGVNGLRITASMMAFGLQAARSPRVFFARLR